MRLYPGHGVTASATRRRPPLYNPHLAAQCTPPTCAAHHRGSPHALRHRWRDAAQRSHAARAHAWRPCRHRRANSARGERSNAPSLRNTCQARALRNERAESPPLASAGHHQTQARAAHQLQKACFQFLSSNLGLVTAWHSSALIPWRACDRRSDAQHRQHTQPPSAGSHGQAAHADSTSGAALRVGHGPSSLGSCIIAHLTSSSSTNHGTISAIFTTRREWPF